MPRGTVPKKSAELTKQIRGWLAEQGYPLELRVAHAAVQAGFSAAQGGRYLDSETGKLREIDVVAERDNFSFDSWLSFTVCIECKSNSGVPWLGLTQPLAAGRTIRRNQFPAGNEMGHRLLRMTNSRDVSDEVMTFSREPQPWCHSVVRALSKSNEDVAYHATMAAARAALDHVNRTESFALGTNDVFLGVAFPLVVVDAPLFLCTLDLRGELVLEEKESLCIGVRHNPGPTGFSVVEVVTERGLNGFLEGLSTTFSWLTDNRQERIRRLIRAARGDAGDNQAELDVGE